MSLPQLCAIVFLAAVCGVIYPYVTGFMRWHFGLAALAAMITGAATMPPPTPEELAARKAAEAKEAAEEARAEQLAAAAKASEQQDKVVAKARPALEVAPNYTRAEYGQTFARVGSKTFARLNGLEPGAAYAAAESSSCDQVSSAMVSDMSKPGAAVWFVDCANENRFMIGQQQAQAALDRFKQGKLARADLEASCTLSSVAMCKATPAQRAAKDREVEYVTACDLILQQAVMSPSSLDTANSWSYDFGKGDAIVIRRAFDSQNGFGAMIRSRYRCEINAKTSNVQGFVVEGPLGAQRVI